MIRLVVTSRCMECGWFDDSAKSDLNARKHVDKEGHAVLTEGKPEEVRDGSAVGEGR